MRDTVSIPGTALVRRPGPRLDAGLITHIERRPIDLDLAARQHQAYVAALAVAGWRIHPLTSADQHADAVFVEDTVVVCGGLAVLTRPGAAERRAEVVGAEKAVRELGLDFARIEAPGTLDGGDVLQVGDTVYVGRSARTNDEAFCQVARLFGALGRRVGSLPVRGGLHPYFAV